MRAAAPARRMGLKKWRMPREPSGVFAPVLCLIAGRLNDRDARPISLQLIRHDEREAGGIPWPISGR